MIEFNSLMEGLLHVTVCPLCQGRVTIFGDVVQITRGYDGWESATIEVDCNKIEVDLKTGRIMSTELFRYEDTVLPAGSGCPPIIISKMPLALPTSGLFFTPVRTGCQKCNRYHVTLQVQFDMDQRRVHKILLNSEYIYVKDGERAFEISNIYTTAATEFGEVRGHGRTDAITTLPLIPMDHQNIDAFIKRVKNLLVFS